jgi:hypothetical protein
MQNNPTMMQSMMTGMMETFKNDTLIMSSMASLWRTLRWRSNIKQKEIWVWRLWITGMDRIIKLNRKSWNITSVKNQYQFWPGCSSCNWIFKKEGLEYSPKLTFRRNWKKKLDVDFRKYKILGACNPTYAYKAIQQEDKIGTMLPCSVIVQDKTMKLKLRQSIRLRRWWL